MHKEPVAGRGHRRLRHRLVAALTAMLTVSPWVAHGQMGSSSRPLSATVVVSYVTHNGSLALLVLWRGSPGWYSGTGVRSGGGGGGGGAGREVGWIRFASGGHTLSVELDYTARVARMLGQEVSLADTNVVLVEDVDGSTGGRIVDRRWVDPSMPDVKPSDARGFEADPAVTAIRRDPAVGAFLQCDIPLPMPPVPAVAGTVDPVVREQMHQYAQALMSDTCRAAAGL